MGDEQGPPELPKGELVKGRYKVEVKLGQGGFGAVYKVTDTRSGELYAMKAEDVREKHGVLKIEVQVLLGMEKIQGQHVCRIVDRGHNTKVSYVVMTLVGPSLQELRKAQDEQKLSLGTALSVGRQALAGLQEIHTIGFIHRDIKPANFAIGREEDGLQRSIFVLDFGLARRYRSKDNQLKTPRDRAGFRGTVRYAPLACHRRQELSRKDDLEMWFYMQVELTTGRLPWKAIEDKDEACEEKESSRLDGTLFKDCPSQYKDLLMYIDRLHYIHEPQYSHVDEGLKAMMVAFGLAEEEPFDWEEGSKHFSGRRQKSKGKKKKKKGNGS